jgi:hypothetical protein
MLNNKAEGEGKAAMNTVFLFVLAVLLLPLPFSCELDYGKVGGSDEGLATYTERADIEKATGFLAGVWYSHYGGRKLDGYRIGKWKDRHALIPPEKAALFPGLDLDNPRFINFSGQPYPAANDFYADNGYPNGLDDAYFVFYDDTVYEYQPGDGGNGGWGDFRMGYVGIVKAVNTFGKDLYGEDSGAVIIQYLEGCFPNWDPDFPGPPPLSYFGVYYRVMGPDTIRMANAVNLGALAAKKKYYTERPTLQGAIELNTVENEGEFISWGVVIPQDREP